MSEDAPVIRYRFRFQSPDGREHVSAVAAVKLAPRPHTASWSHQELVPGQKAKLKLQAPGRDGEPVHLIVERRVGNSWETIGHTAGEVKDGAVEVEHEMPHLLAPGGDQTGGDHAGNGG